MKKIIKSKQTTRQTTQKKPKSNQPTTKTEAKLPASLNCFSVEKSGLDFLRASSVPTGICKFTKQVSVEKQTPNDQGLSYLKDLSFE